MAGFGVTNAGLLSGFQSVCEAHGVDVRRLLGGTGVDEAEIGDCTRFLPSAAVARLLEDAAKAGAVPTFGLRLAKVRDLVEAFGLIAELSRSCTSFREAMEVFLKYQHLIDQSAIWDLKIRGRLAYLTRHNVLPASVHALQFVSLEVANSFLRYAKSFGPRCVDGDANPRKSGGKRGKAVSGGGGIRPG